MKLERTYVMGMPQAIRGMRNSMNSWRFADSTNVNGKFSIGPKDLRLGSNLVNAGGSHRKFIRQIFVSVDITGSLYWWKEFDTYKVGTVANSCSTMHKLLDSPITIDCFDFDKDASDFAYTLFKTTVEGCEALRNRVNNATDPFKRHADWRSLIQTLPESWLQMRTVTMSYENILHICNDRHVHKLCEWTDTFCNWARDLPYSKELLKI